MRWSRPINGWHLMLVVLALTLALGCAPQTAPPAPTAPAAPAKPEAKSGKQQLEELVNKAKQEGELVVPMQTNQPAEVGPRLAEGFKKRFGLEIKVSVTLVDSAKHLAEAIAETKAGAPTTYDVHIPGNESHAMQVIGAGAAQRINGWDALLAEINPLVGSGKVKPEQVSRGPLTGYGFIFMGYVKHMVYNSKLIKADELPRTHADLGDPKFTGKFVQPPWLSHWDVGSAVVEGMDRAKWLEVMRQAGKNTGAVLTEAAGVDRVLLGEYAFVLAQDTHLRNALAKDPSASLGAKFFTDYNPFNAVPHLVHKGARHPAAGTLFALWMTSPDAEAIWQPAVGTASPYGESEIDQEQAKLIRESGARVVSFLDSDKTVELLNWYLTDDGGAYLESMAKAIRGQ